ncbi:MAG: glycosyltransferase family 39 protein [Ardenticatenaceae bacterium]|nr:glycosyltransferase family 39 protein [Ardenticatenaceae bacterium]
MRKPSALSPLSSLLPLLLLAFALRLFRLDAQSLWWDEGISLHLATSSIRDIIADRAANIHPPLYFFALKGWLQLVGVSPFTARYLSLLASWLQVAAVYALTRHWFNKKIALIAALLITLSPLSIIYAQETRVYALLPLFYILLLLLISHLLRSSAPPLPRSLLLLGLLEWIGFHLHYITAFALAYAAIWTIIVLYQQKRWVDLRRWLAVQVAVGLASLPWLWLVWLNRTAVTTEANAGTYLTQPTPIPYLIAQVWTFHLTGLPGSLSRPIIQILAILIALSLSLLLLLHFHRPSPLVPRPSAPPPLLPWLLPLTAAFLAWSIRSFAHPRYVTIFAVMLIPLMAGLIGDWRLKTRDWRSSLQSLVSSLLFLPLLILSLYSLYLYYFDPNVAKDDMRGVAQYLEVEANEHDLILVPDTDWSLPFEYHGVATIAMPATSNRAAMWPHLQQLTQGKQRVFLVEYERGSVDWQHVVPYALEEVGNLTGQPEFGNLYVSIYHIDEAITAPQMTPQMARFGSLHLTAVSTPPTPPPANNAITLALQWQPTQPLSDRYHITLRLLDADGWQLAQLDNVLIDEIGRPTELWPMSQPITTYHTLPLPLGTPPLTYDLALTVYATDEAGEIRPLEILDTQGAPQGQRWPLPPITLAAPQGPSNPYQQVSPVTQLRSQIEMGDGLVLWGADVNRTEVGAGQPLYVQLQWQATRPLSDLRPALQLVQNGRILTANNDIPSLGRYPTNNWPPIYMVVEHRQLTVPAAAVGPAQLILSLHNSQYTLADIEITAATHLFEPPLITHPLNVQFGDVARLVGYDLPQTSLSSSEPVPLTLYWQSLTTGSLVDYVVFTHILADDGHLIGQHDSPPDNGRRPSTTWVTDEYITDPHSLTFRESYTGNGRIEIGLYDPLTGTRLQTAAGADFFYLPLTLEIK